MSTEQHIWMNGRKVGLGEPTYIVVEVSSNHHQSFEKAIDLVREAKRVGADAVKLQTYTADTMTFPSSDSLFQIHGGTIWDGQTLYELYQKAYTPWDWQPRLKEEAEKIGLHFFSTPFDPSAVDFLQNLHVPAFKIGSAEIVDHPLLKHAAKTGKPLIISTGMATLDEIEDAVKVCKGEGATQLALLVCSSAYPTPIQEMRLSNIQDLRSRFGVVVGLSDHSFGSSLAVASVMLGASIVEKHMTLSRKTHGPDSEFSMEPHEFAAMVSDIRAIEASLRQTGYGPTEHERSSVPFRRSLFVVKNMKSGDTFSTMNLKSIRPAAGLPPKFMEKILGKRATIDLHEGTPLRWEHVEGGEP